MSLDQFVYIEVSSKFIWQIKGIHFITMYHWDRWDFGGGWRDICLGFCFFNRVETLLMDNHRTWGKLWVVCMDIFVTVGPNSRVGNEANFMHSLWMNYKEEIIPFVSPHFRSTTLGRAIVLLLHRSGSRVAYHGSRPDLRVSEWKLLVCQGKPQLKGGALD